MAKQNFRTTATQAEKIIADITAGKIAPIYLLMGNESYYIDMIANQLATSVLTPEEQSFNQIILYGRDTDGGSVVSQARRYPMMSSRQVVIVREAQMMSGIDNLSHYFAQPMPSTVLVICHKEKSLDKRSTLYRSLTQFIDAVILESVAPRDYEISQWVTTLLKLKGCNIEPKAVEMIVSHIGANLQKIDQEIDKLLTLLPEGTRNITAQQIEDNIGISKDFNVFELTLALSNRNFRQALAIAEYFAANQRDNPVQATLSLLSTHFQRIITYNIHQWECRKQNHSMGSDYDIAKLLKLSNAYFVGEYITAARNYPGAKASNILSLIREWDMKSKGMNIGSIGSETLLQELILRISAA